MLDVWIQLVWENDLLEGVDIEDEKGLELFKRLEPGIFNPCTAPAP